MKYIKNIYNALVGKFFYGIMLGAVTFSAVSCTDIDENDRLKYVGKVEVKKHVLIEDFTGQRCINCPKAASLISQLQESFGEDNIIAVGIYGGDFGYTPVSQGHTPLSLTTADGDSYYTTWGVKAQPSGMVDRTGGVLSNLAYWTAYVNGLIKNKPTVMITPTTKYDSNSKSLTVDVDIVGLQTLQNARLQVWLIEDGIVDMQYMTDGSVNKEYVHNHVFRATVNDKNGDPIDVVEHGEVKKSYSINIKDEWKAENMSVVTFVFTPDGVQQTEKIAVVK